MRAANRVPAILRDLQTGYGAQRLPTSLLAIEVRGVTTNRTRPTVRHFLKTILPRVKYNNPALRIEIQKVKVIDSEAKATEAKEAKEATEGARRVKREPNASARLIFDKLPAQIVQFDGHSTANDVARSVFERIAQVTGEIIQSASMGAGGFVHAHAVQTRGNAKKLSTEPKKNSKTQKAKAAITAEDAADVPPLAEAEAATSSDEPEYVYTPYVKPTKPTPDAEDAAGKATQQQL